jgi:hypothetical protein
MPEKTWHSNPLVRIWIESEKNWRPRLRNMQLAISFPFSGHSVPNLLPHISWPTLQNCNFLGLRNLCSLIDLSSLCNFTGLTSLYSPIFSKNFLILMIWAFLAPKWPILVLFCEMDHQKSNFSLIYGTLFVRGCWGQLMFLFWKLVTKLKCPILRNIQIPSS